MNWLRRRFFGALHRIAWWRSGRGHKSAGRFIYHFLCPYPIDGNYTARSCIAVGNCFCANHPDPKARKAAA